MAGSTTNPAVQQWLARLREAGKSKNTCQSYARALDHLVGWWASNEGSPFEVGAVDARQLQAWKEHQLLVERAKPATVNLRLVAVSRLLKWATDEGLRAGPPSTTVGTVTLPVREPRGLDERTIACLRQQAAREGDARNVALLEVLLGTGMRVSEVLALRQGDLSLAEDRGEVVVRGGRGANDRRVPLTDPVRQALLNYLKQRQGQEHQEGVWEGQRGSLRDRTAVFRILKQWAWKAGLDETIVSPQALRWTFGRRYLAANPGDLRGLAHILGNISLTSVSAYAPAPGDLAQRMERVEEGTERRCWAAAMGLWTGGGCE